MTKEAIGYINSQLEAAGINYEFGVWNSDIVYPYFVGEYNESDAALEDGLHEADFFLNGFTRGSWLDLENAKKIIENVFSGNTTILSNGSGIDISYAGSLVVPTGDAELKRLQINLKIKEWQVN